MPQTPTLRRLMRESRELSPNPPAPLRPNPTFHAAPAASNLHEWHFTLLGPPQTPYAGGMYHGRIVLPPTYPLRPPSFRFLTPSGRFEVNREICLSISGFHEESWQPAWGVRLALTALRVFMVEEGKGQVGGLEASDSVRKQLAERSRSWKCQACGAEAGAAGRSNEEIMKEWWASCRERGVQVGANGEVVEGTGDGDSEKIPEELRLGYRDELGSTGTQSQDSAATAKSSTSDGAKNAPSPPAPQSEKQEAQSNELSHPNDNSTLPSAISTSTASTLPNHSNNTTTTTSTSMSSNAPEILPPGPSRTLQEQQHRQQQAQLQTQQRHAQHTDQTRTPYLDKAISGVMIALLLMVLKKVLWP